MASASFLIKRKDDGTINLIWVGAVLAVGTLLGVLLSYASVTPQVNRLQQQSSQLRAVVAEQNRALSAPRVFHDGSAGRQLTGVETPLQAQDAQRAAAARPIAEFSAPPGGTPVAAAAPSNPAVARAVNPATDSPPAIAPARPPAARQVTPPPQIVTKGAIAVAPPAPVPVAPAMPAEHVAVSAPAQPGGGVQETAPVSTAAAPAPAVAASTVAPAIKPTVRATLAQSNIAGLDGGSVTFKSGTRVEINGVFTSGERLISVQPVTRRIETDRRIIFLEAPPGPAAN